MTLGSGVLRSTVARIDGALIRSHVVSAPHIWPETSPLRGARSAASDQAREQRAIATHEVLE